MDCRMYFLKKIFNECKISSLPHYFIFCIVSFAKQYHQVHVHSINKLCRFDTSFGSVNKLFEIE